METHSFISLYNLLTLGILALLALIYFKKYTKPGLRLPPGPPRVPFIGTVLFHGFGLGDFKKLHKKYGDIFTVYAGNHCVIALNSYEVMNEAFVTKYKAFSARSRGWFNQSLNNNKIGFVSGDYSPAFEQKRCKILNILRSLGFGKSIMEEKIRNEMNIFIDMMKFKNGKAFNPWDEINSLIANIFLGLMYNERADSITAGGIEHHVEKFFQTGMEVIVCDFFPITRHLPYIKPLVKDMLDSHAAIMDHIHIKVREHLESHTPGQDSDFLHAFIESCINPETNEFDYDKEEFEYIIRDFLLAGLETTAVAMKWLLVILANNPEIQDKALKQIEDNVGSNHTISISDRDKLSYIEAVIMEAQRYKTIAPYAIQHAVTQNETIAGYDIPAGALLEPVITHAHMDKRTWGDPETFRPERFIDDQGRYVRHQKAIPFSMGKRQCVGELLARQQMFVFASFVLQNFKILPPEGVERIDEEGHPGFTFSPKPFEIRAILR